MAEQILEKLRSWLSDYPHWDEFCLLPKSLEETSRLTDLTGNQLIEYSYYVNLYWQLPSLGNEAENACRLLQLQNWIREQCVMREIPQLGDMTALDRIRAEKGGLTLGANSVAYTVTLVADFVKAYRV